MHFYEAGHGTLLRFKCATGRTPDGLFSFEFIL